MSRHLYWLPPLAWMGVIYYLSGRTAGEIKSIFPFLQNLNPGHVLAFFILSILFFYALTKAAYSRHPYVWSMFLSIIYGITDEYHQSFVPGRTPDFQDLLRDALGAAIALVFLYILEKKKKQKQKSAS